MTQELALFSDENPDIVYGGLLESAHITGYSAERMCQRMEWLLEEGPDRWRSVSPGYEHFDDFIATIDLSAFNFSTDRRQRLSRRMTDLGATTRKAAKALGVSNATVSRDVHGDDVTDVTPEPEDSVEDKAEPTTPVTDVTPELERLSELEDEAAEEVSEPELGGPRNGALYTSESDDWWTPKHVIERVEQTLGGIDLDPCSNLGQPNVRADVHHTIEDDGLIRPWFGRVYMNPPYGGVLGQWVDKLITEYRHGDVKAAIALVPSRTDTQWFRRFAPYPRCFLWGRLRFSGHDNSAPFPSMAVYLGDDVPAFVTAFSNLGDTYGRL